MLESAGAPVVQRIELPRPKGSIRVRLLSGANEICAGVEGRSVAEPAGKAASRDRDRGERRRAERCGRLLSGAMVYWGGYHANRNVWQILRS